MSNEIVNVTVMLGSNSGDTELNLEFEKSFWDRLDDDGAKYDAIKQAMTIDIISEEEDLG